MLASKGFIPTIKDTPQDAEIISHQLMLRSGMIRKVASGIYNWLPLGLKVLKKVEHIVRQHMNDISAQEIFMPVLQPKELWDQTGRWEKYGPELIRLSDRHDREFCLGPTHEEIITELVKKNLTSYKSLPLTLYQIQTKFRDEIRPRFGVMRGREFLMKDAYSFHQDEECLSKTYQEIKNAYKSIICELGLEYKNVIADSGAIGGTTSEEFHIIAENGEDFLAISDNSNVAINAEVLLENGQKPASLIDKEHPNGGKIKLARGIEVGHIFQLGQLYSKKIGFSLQDKHGKQFIPFMGCYGVGISRLVAACIEQCHDKNGICWPKKIAPFDINIFEAEGDGLHKETAMKIYKNLKDKQFEVLYDDRPDRFGKKIKDSNLLGIPINIVIGKNFKDEEQVEIIQRNNEKNLVKESELISYLTKLFQE